MASYAERKQYLESKDYYHKSNEVFNLVIGDEEHTIQMDQPHKFVNEAARTSLSLRRPFYGEWTTALYFIKAMVGHEIKAAMGVDGDTSNYTLQWGKTRAIVNANYAEKEMTITMDNFSREMLGVCFGMIVIGANGKNSMQDVKMARAAMKRLDEKIDDARMGMFVEGIELEIAAKWNIIIYTEPQAIDMWFQKVEAMDAFTSKTYTNMSGYFSEAIKPIATEGTDAEDSSVQSMARQGLFKLHHEFEDNLHIPPIEFLDGVVMGEEFEALLLSSSQEMTAAEVKMAEGLENEAAIASPANYTLVGTPGTGKSTYARALAASLGMPFYSIPCGAHTEEDTFTGKTLPADGGLMQVETDFCKAFRCGGVIVLEEANLMNPGVLMGTLSQALVAPYVLYKNGVTPVKRHPLTIIIVAFNPDLAGTQGQNDAFYNRCPTVIPLEAPSKEKTVEVIIKQSKLPQDEGTKKLVNAMYGVYEDVQKELLDPENDAEEYSSMLSARNVIQATRNFFALAKVNHVELDEKYYKPFAQAAKYAFLTPFYIKDRELYKKLEEAFTLKLKDGINYRPRRQ